MRTVNPARDHAFADLTARARIRDAALRQFAAHGIEGATLRGIAAEAGVSPGLVQHHYGSKDGLRAACDAYVLESIRRQARQALDEGRMADPAFLDAAFASAPLVTGYLVRALVDGSPAASGLFDELVRLTEAYLAGVDGGADVHARAAVLTAMKLGISVFRDHLARALGVRDLAGEAYARVARATLDILSPRVIRPDLAAQARTGLDRYEQEPSSNSPRQKGDERDRHP